MQNFTPEISGPKTGQLNRRFDIDWLRILAVLLLFTFHSGRIFDIWEPFYAKSDQTSAALSYIFVGIVGIWHMQLFFLLAGASTWFALRFRSGQQYAGERFKRLLLPFIFGLLVIVPPQSYFGALTYHNFSGSLLQYYPHFFALGPNGGLEGYQGGFTPGHLWFILMLFLLSLAGLPLFLWLRGERGQRIVDRLTVFLTRPGAIYLLALPLVVAGFLPDMGGKNPFYYFVFFVYGYVLMMDGRFEEIVDRHKRSALVLGWGALAVWLAVLALDLPVPGWFEQAAEILYPTLFSWCCLLSLLGYGRKYLNFGNRFLTYTAEGAYAFYILHQTVIVVIGYYVVQWSLGIWPKFLVITLVSLVTTTLLYELFVRRINVLRFLFGMKPRPKIVPRVAAQMVQADGRS